MYRVLVVVVGQQVARKHDREIATKISARPGWLYR
jgi:hypothetical protein